MSNYPGIDVDRLRVGIVYARVSVDDGRDADDAGKSVRIQTKICLDAAAKMGVHIPDEHIFCDDGISGGELVRRPGYVAIKNLVFGGAADVVFVSDFDRLVRHETRGQGELQDFFDSDCEVYAVLKDAFYDFRSEQAALLGSIEAYKNNAARKDSAKKARKHLQERAEVGYVTGGACFGFRNKIILNEDGSKRVRTEYRIDPDQAFIVRGIFKAYDAGLGITKIAKVLNGDSHYRDLSLKFFDGLTPDPPQLGRTGSWAPSTIREMLHNEKYIGIFTWGRRENFERRGRKKGLKRAQTDPDKIVTFKNKDLAIVPDKLWKRVHIRIAANADKFFGGAAKRKAHCADTRSHSKYLLSGKFLCANCGFSMVADYKLLGPKGRKQKDYFYRCNAAKKRGTTVCDMNLRPSMEEVDNLVIDYFASKLLTPDTIRDAVREAQRRIELTLAESPDKPRRLQAEIDKVRAQLDRFVAAIADGKAPDTVLTAIREREDKIRDLEKQLGELAPPPESDFNSRATLEALETRLTHFRTLLLENVPGARQVLSELLKGPLMFEPKGDGGYAVTGETVLGPLLPPDRLAPLWYREGDLNPQGVTTGGF